MDEWKCVKASDSSYWTLGKVYKTDEKGYLRDDDGDKRLPPEVYNEVSESLRFELIPGSIENE